MKLSILAMLTLFFVSCGNRNTGRAPASMLGIDLNQVETGQLSGQQKTLALNLCYELKYKNINWRTNLAGTQFRFKIEEQTCDAGDLPERIVETSLHVPTETMNPMIFNPKVGESLPYPEVLTENQGVLADICTKLIQGREADNIVAMAPGEQTMLYFHQKSKDGYDGLSLITFDTATNASKTVVTTEISLDQHDNFKGLERRITSNVLCPNGREIISSQIYQP